MAEARPQLRQNPKIIDILNGLEMIVRALIGKGTLTDKLQQAATKDHTFFKSMAICTTDKLAAIAKISPKQFDEPAPANKEELSSCAAKP